MTERGQPSSREILSTAFILVRVSLSPNKQQLTTNNLSFSFTPSPVYRAMSVPSGAKTHLQIIWATKGELHS